MDRINDWLATLDAHRALAYPLIRIFLGLALFIRGWLFIADSDAAVRLVTEQGGDWMWPVALIHYIALAHLVGGLMLAVGLFTRVGALVQIPILIGAVFFVHAGEGLLASGQSLELSVLVLFLLGVFLLFGSGGVSVDQFLGRQAEERVEERPLAAA